MNCILIKLVECKLNGNYNKNELKFAEFIINKPSDYLKKSVNEIYKSSCSVGNIANARR